jgi:8-oxo-dGTP pyrophosphatase MutT (NUDIX family)
VNGCRSSPADLDRLQAEAAVDGRHPVAGALILDDRGRVFVQRRGPNRSFLANGWDLVGGHVEAGESLLEALAREVNEETGWTVRFGSSQPPLAFVGDWRTDPDDPASARREFDFLVEVDGDLDRPRLEWPQHTEHRWIGPDELDLLDENGGRDDGLVRHLAALALRSAVGAPAFPHVTLFLDGELAEPIEALRRRWDPAMASQIGAHVTVAYPEEIGSVEEMTRRVRLAVERIGPFELRLGSAFRRQDGHPWVGLHVDDPDSGWRRLRELIVPSAARVSEVEPHVTLVHPRHSNLGDQAWEALDQRFARRGKIAIRHVAVTAIDGRSWQTLEQVPLLPATT